jgi:hypothetical protein
MKYGLIASLDTTSGEVYDGHYFTELVDHDLKQALPVETYAADKGYYDGENQYNLEVRGLYSAIHLKRLRTEKKDPNKQIWLDFRQTPQNQQGLKERYKVERKFGEAKQGLGLGRCRYLGRVSFAMQSFFTPVASTNTLFSTHSIFWDFRLASDWRSQAGIVVASILSSSRKTRKPR